MIDLSFNHPLPYIFSFQLLRMFDGKLGSVMADGGGRLVRAMRKVS